MGCLIKKNFDQQLDHSAFRILTSILHIQLMSAQVATYYQLTNYVTQVGERVGILERVTKRRDGGGNRKSDLT